MRSAQYSRSAALVAGALMVLFNTACEDSAGPPEDRVTAFEKTSGDLQGGVVATALAQPLIIRAVDVDGKPVGGASVTWQVTSGAGTIAAAAATTAGDGTASATWTLGPTAGQQTATVSLGTATTVSATFQATAIAGPAASIIVSPPTLTLDAIGATSALTTVIRDAQNNIIESRAPAWTSTNAAVASVTAAGIVRANTVGTATVTASLDGAVGEAAITVQPQPSQILLNPAGAQLNALGQTVQFAASAKDRNGNPINLSPTDYVWTTSDPAVVTVNTTGLATAAGAGFAQVRAAAGSAIGQAQVTVSPAVASLAVSPQIDTLTTARPAVQLAAIARDANGQIIISPSLMWSTTDAAIATVSSTGSVNAVANGTVFIKVTSGTAADSARITVRLNAPPRTVADALATAMNTSLVVAAPGVLANDTLGVPAGMVTSFGGGSLGGTVASNGAGTTVSFGTGGSLRVAADGGVTFTPSTGFNGTFTFMYRVQTVAGTSDATVSIAVGVPPVAVDDGYATTMNVAINIAAPGVISNDTQGFPLATVASFGGGVLGGTATTFQANQLVAFGIGGFIGGLLRLNNDGSLALTPPTGYTGSFTFQYRLTNGLGNSDATITITVTPAPLPD